MLNIILLTFIIYLVPLAAKAAPLKIVNVSAPAINCVFNPSCSVSVKDSSGSFSLSAGGSGTLKSRTFKGADGTPAAGLFVYEYRLDLREAVGFTALSCMDWMTVSFGPVVSTLNYGGDSKPDQVFVISTGGIGTIGLTSAVQTRNAIKFKFKSPVCAGTSPGKGDSTFFWGLVSKKPPTNVTATVHEMNGVTLVVKARSPM